ncbi:MAG: metallophosphoesterase [Deltaproteobacteria bacterium]|nr:metallophosphoesterase [Deltaproteobacteria bacterium]
MKLLRVSQALAGLLVLAPLTAHAGQRAPLTIAVYGDAPYGTSPTDTSQLAATPAFIDAVNADPDVSLVVHVGDIHAGKQYCTEAYDQAVAALWTRFQDPLIYTPGDNEWADCHKKAEGGGVYNAATGAIDYLRDASGELLDYAGGDPIANLDLIRTTFFPRAGVALGGGRKFVASQAWFHDWFHPEDADFVENVIWEQDRVVFVTINLPGGSNNDQDPWYGAPAESAAQADERAARTAADLRWLDAAFATARFTRAKGVVIVAQADMWDPEKGAAHQAGYEPVVAKVAAGATAFGGPVLMLNGDSHVYLSDNPLAAADPLNYMHPGYDVPNFHRIVVHGSTTPLEYLKLVVDPRADAPSGADAFGPFRWTRVTE